MLVCHEWWHTAAMWMSESLVVRLYGVGDVDKPRAMLETLTGELREERQINSGEFLATAEWAGRRVRYVNLLIPCHRRAFTPNVAETVKYLRHLRESNGLLRIVAAWLSCKCCRGASRRAELAGGSGQSFKSQVPVSDVY